MKSQPEKSKRGFAAMLPERQRQIASLGGKSAHQLGVAHRWDSEEAKKAGKKGGQMSGHHRKVNRTEHDSPDPFL